MKHILALLLFCFLLPAKVVVFWQEGFPTIDSQPIERQTLAAALEPLAPEFAGAGKLSLDGATLLVLPYGSAFPVEAWKSISGYLRKGGSLLVLGGRPLAAPVPAGPSETTAWSRRIGIWHTYEAPQRNFARFAWDDDLYFLPGAEVRARRVFVLGIGRGGGSYRGIGFLQNARGDRIAAAVTRLDNLDQGTRHVFLPFDPEPGYWSSAAGRQLIRDAATYAAQGPASLWLEMHNASLAPGEAPQVVARWRSAAETAGKLTLEVLGSGKRMATSEIAVSGASRNENVLFPERLTPGHYVVRGSFAADGRAREAYHTGFWVRDENILRSGLPLAVNQDFFVKGGAPFFPFGTNYFSTDVFPTGFFTGGNLAGNAFAWERDFTEMEQHNVTFARTGIWLNHGFYLDRVTGAVEERLLRAIEAYLLSAGRHNVHVNFTFFAFDPQTIQRHPGQQSALTGPGSNPYTDPVAIRAQKRYALLIVERFKSVPYLSWDLINEPSFSNPKTIFRGNVPNADPTEAAAWNRWLEKRYSSTAALARAWGKTEDEIPAFGSVPLPESQDLARSREGNERLVRAVDYNLFAQDAFNHWASEMIAAIRGAGSRQLVTVGQDEGGVTNRLLNQFYAGSGVDFTVNHSWWQDDALLWDSVAAKRPGLPNLIGETGVQPAGRMDATWRWDEVNALGLFERKMALGFAAANSGALHWDWSRGDTFGILRRDGSFKSWAMVLDRMGDFARKASPYATGLEPPEVAIVLPQSLQLSVFNNLALEAQQNSVRALFHQARHTAYVAGEYQLQFLGTPKLILLPSPWVLRQEAWVEILSKVREGATLLLTGRFDLDEHFLPRERAGDLGLDYRAGLLDTREALVRWPDGEARFRFAGDKTTYLERGILASGENFVEKALGRGRVLYSPLPLELGGNEEALGAVYRYALRRAGVEPIYAAKDTPPGVLISPTRLAQATLYVLTSEVEARAEARFRDIASGRDFQVPLEPGRAALLLVRRDGKLAASYP